MTQKDIRKTSLYQEAEALYLALRRPGMGLVSDAAEITTNGTLAVFAGTLVEELNGAPPTRICTTDLTTGETRVATFGPNIDRSPKFSPDGRRVAFLSDRHQRGNFQLYILDPIEGSVRPAPHVEGWVEYLHWSPDGERILLGVAGFGAELSGAQGAILSKHVADDVPSWMPAVETGNESYLWRRAWVYEFPIDRVYQVSPAQSNVWEAVWCGRRAFAAVLSPGPGEGLWYNNACLHIVDLETGKSREIYAPPDQFGFPAASPSGKHVAIIEAICSDRWCVAGDLRLIETISGKIARVNTQGVDITYIEWRSDRCVLLVGYRGVESVVSLYDVQSGAFTELWSSRDVTAGSVSGFNEKGDCVVVSAGFVCAPELAVIRNGEYHPVKSFDLGYSDHVKAIEFVELVRWNAPDGLEIQGWLLRPKGNGPHPLVMNIHGGPVGAVLSGRMNPVHMLLVKHGFAVFLPNVRGSTGRGQGFVRHVLGDMAGAETYDFLSGLDYLVERGIADPKRLGVSGGSYGGFMTSWLITQSSRFAAAVSVAPWTNQVTEQLLSNIPNFVSSFLKDHYSSIGGKYFERSPVLHASRVKTPTLNICGALDRSAPPEEAAQFHHALLENGVTSALITYPEEGHGIRKFPAMIDYAARVVGWFEAYL